MSECDICAAHREVNASLFVPGTLCLACFLTEIEWLMEVGED